MVGDRAMGDEDDGAGNNEGDELMSMAVVG